MKSVLFSSIFALGMGLCACNGGAEKHEDTVDSAKAVNKETKAVEKDASNFAVTAANGGMLEVALGKVAQMNASDPKVKSFGEMMVMDHTAANEKLKSIASSLNIALPDSLSDDSRKEVDKLKMKKGRDFDKAYVSMMVDDHKKDIKEFQDCANNSSDSTLKTFAAATIPTLQKHLAAVEALDAKK